MSLYGFKFLGSGRSWKVVEISSPGMETRWEVRWKGAERPDGDGHWWQNSGYRNAL